MEIHGRTQPLERRPVRVPTWVAKATMAITGVIMAAFVLIHMIGNLKVLADPASMDSYAAWLRQVGYPLIPHEGVLWAFRITLSICLIAHLTCAVILWRRGARTKTPGAASMGVNGWGARLMLPTGIALGLFVIVHLLDLTIGALVAPASFRHPDPEFHAAANVAASLGRPLMAAFYLFVLLALAAHLIHGFPVAWRDLGGTGPRARIVATAIGHLCVVAILLGDGAVVIAALIGAI